MTKENLKQYRWILKNMSNIKNKQREIRDRLENTVPPPGDEIRGQSFNDRMAAGIAKLCELKELYDTEWDKAIDTQLEIERAIQGLPEQERMLIRYRYIDGHSWEKICVKMRYAWAQTHRLHAKALETLKHDTK